jgi:uncharacterized protein YjbJ (UPF0337 family)
MRLAWASPETGGKAGQLAGVEEAFMVDTKATREQLKGKVNQAAGKARASAGEMLGDEAMEARGRAQEMKGRAEEAKGDARAAISRGKEKARSAIDRARR